VWNGDVDERTRFHGRKKYRALRDAALAALGGCCARCGFSDKRALQIDHVDGGGAVERRTKAPVTLYKEIAAGGSEGYQILCANCNWIKRHENAEHSFHRGRPKLNSEAVKVIRWAWRSGRATQKLLASIHNASVSTVRSVLHRDYSWREV
jgi:hypothetical protein